MQGQNKEIVRDIVTATQLQNELQLGQAQHGVVVLDIYNAEWGHCKALGETFRRLFTDAGDNIYLRFFSVECNAVLESLLNPEVEAKGALRPRSAIEYCADTLSNFWSGLLESRRDHSKPYFLFYKEGKMRCHQEGIDTPRIYKVVQDLCKQQSPASDHITNKTLLQFWKRHFSQGESEVTVTEFVAALRTERGDAAIEMNATDTARIVAAAGEREGMITAAGLQIWIGDDGDLMESVAALVPDRPSEHPIMDPPESHKLESAPQSNEGASNEEPEAEPSPETQAEQSVEAEGGHTERTEAVAEEEPVQFSTVAPEHDAANISEEATSGLELSESREAASEEVEQPEANLDAADLTETTEAAEAADTAEVTETAETAEATETTEAVGVADGVGTNAADREAHESGGAHTENQVSTVNQIYINRWVTVSDEEMRVWNILAGLQLRYPHSASLALTPFDEEHLPTLPAGGDLATLHSYLLQCGLADAAVSIMCLAADQKVGSESLTLGKLALILLSCDAEAVEQLLPDDSDFIGELSRGTLLTNHPALAYTALCLCASEAYHDECFHYTPTEEDISKILSFNVEDAVVLSALTPLKTNTPADTTYAVRIVGLPKVIELATTDESEDVMVLSQWYARLAVVEKSEDSITLQFVDNCTDTEFNEFSDLYTARLVEEENGLDKKSETQPDAVEEL